MEKLTRCRICLVENVRMHAVTDVQLQETFERLNNIPFVTEDSRPVLACFFCYARLKQCSRFMTKCLEAEQVFTRILNEDYEPKPLSCLGEYFGRFIRTSVENIDIVDGDPDKVHVKEELLDDSITDNNVHKTDDDSDGSITTEDGETQVISIKEELQIHFELSTDQDGDHDRDGAPAEKKRKQVVLKEKFGDTITKNRKDNVVRPHKCDICHSSFIKKGHLESHIRIHTGEKPYTCDTCLSSFTEKGALKKHLLTHTRLKPYKCDICQNSYTRKNGLLKHSLTHSGEKPYKCDICHSNFARKCGLQKHILTHTGEKPFKCDICHSRFNQKAHLKTHTRTHTGEKPFKCNKCQSSFSRKDHLLRHIRRHSGGKQRMVS